MRERLNRDHPSAPDARSLKDPPLLSRWKLAVFSGPAIPLAALGLPLVVFLPNYYADDLAMPLALVGFAFALIRSIDIPVDPLLGALMDHTRTRFGRFKPWMAASIPVLMASIYMLFMARKGVGFAYLSAWLFVGYLGFSMAYLASIAWGASLELSYEGRSRVYTWLQGVSVLGSLLVLILPAVLAKAGVGGDAAGVQAMGWFGIVLVPVAFIACLALVDERKVAASRPRAGLADYARVLRRGSVLVLLGTDLSISTATAVAGSLFFFYFEQLKGFSKGDAEIFLLAYFVSALGGGVIWMALGNRIGKHRALAVGGVVLAGSLLLANAIPPGRFWIMLGAMALAGVPFSTSSVLVRSMLADISDQERLHSGEDRTGLLFAISSGNVKIANAAAVGVTFAVLQMIGFNPTDGAVNSPPALQGLGVLFAIGPSALALVAAVLILRYPLTAERHGEIRRRLDAMDAASAAGELHGPSAAE